MSAVTVDFIIVVVYYYTYLFYVLGHSDPPT